MVLGKNNAICGNATRKARQTPIASQNGQMPLKMVPIGTSFATLLTTKTLTPTGGEIRPISNTITTTTPNQIGSNPNSMITGNTMYSVRTSMARPSSKVPRAIYLPIPKVDFGHLMVRF